LIELALSLLLARPDAPGTDELFRFDDGDVVEVFDTARFRVHFTRAGTHGVPLSDADGSGVPDHVEQIGVIYEDVLDFYQGALGYRAPVGDDGTDAANDDARFDVYLVDFAFSADGSFRAESCSADTCAGFMVQENDFAGYGYPSVTYANRLLASHELFHAVQAAYDTGQGAVLAEGTAVWASEQFDPTLDDLEGFGQSYLADTGRPLNSDGSGPVDPFTYGAAIFFDYIAQAHGDDVVRAIWESVVPPEGGGAASDWFEELDSVLVAAGGTGFADDFTSFATATLPDVVPERETLPLSKPSLLVFISSWRTIDANPGPRANLRVALAGSGDDVDGVRLVLAPDGVNAEIIPPLAEVSAEGAFFDVTRPGLDAFFAVQVINTRQAGNGARPRLCIGDDDEVSTCLAEENAGEDAAGDAGPLVPPPLTQPPVCACATTRPNASGAPLAGAAVVVTLASLTRRRRRRVDGRAADAL
jgi:hypothetical protein